jgi:RNA polymerase sigma-70 factor, ECF subfamily
LRERLPLEDPAALAAVDTLAMEDLLLAFACLEHQSAALNKLETELFPKAARSLRRLDASIAFRDEVLQQVRAQLLVGDGKAPKLASYLGRGPLVGWLRTVMLGVGLNALKQRGPKLTGDGESALMHLAASRDDLELKYLKSRYRKEFEEIFKANLAALDARTRNVLRLRFVDGLTLKQIARMYRVHTTTALRWLEASRETLLQQTRAGLEERLKIPRVELDSLIAALQSGLELSLRKLL